MSHGHERNVYAQPRQLHVRVCLLPERWGSSSVPQRRILPTGLPGPDEGVCLRRAVLLVRRVGGLGQIRFGMRRAHPDGGHNLRSASVRPTFRFSRFR